MPPHSAPLAGDSVANFEEPGMQLFDPDQIVANLKANWRYLLYPAILFVAFVFERVLWQSALFMSSGLMLAMTLSLVLASEPLVNARYHYTGEESLDSRGAWRWFILPALLIHVATFAFLGAHWRGGRSVSGHSIFQVAKAWSSDARLAELLVEASRNNWVSDLEFHLRLGADPAVPDEEGVIAIEAARSLEAIDLLLAHGAKVDPEGIATALYYLAEEGDDDAVRRLLAEKANPNATNDALVGNTAAHGAALRNRASTLRILLEAGADPGVRNGRGSSVWDIARDYTSSDAVAVLEASGKKEPARPPESDPAQ